MKETSFTPGPYEVVEHNWSDTSIYANGKQICTHSIYDEATEDTQEELEAQTAANFRLFAASPDLYAALDNLTATMKAVGRWNTAPEVERAMKQAQAALTKANGQ